MVIKNIDCLVLLRSEHEFLNINNLKMLLAFKYFEEFQFPFS